MSISEARRYVAGALKGRGLGHIHVSTEALFKNSIVISMTVDEAIEFARKVGSDVV